MTSLEFLAVIVSFVVALILFVAQDYFKSWIDSGRTRNRVKNNLITELEENKAIQEKSTYVPLLSLAWEEAKNTGVYDTFSNEIRRLLLQHYVSVVDKNELLKTWRVTLSPNETVYVLGADNSRKPLADVLGQLRDEIKDQIDLLLPKLRDMK